MRLYEILGETVRVHERFARPAAPWGGLRVGENLSLTIFRHRPQRYVISMCTVPLVSPGGRGIHNPGVGAIFGFTVPSTAALIFEAGDAASA